MAKQVKRRCTHPIYKGPYRVGAGICICSACGKLMSVKPRPRWYWGGRSLLPVT